MELEIDQFIKTNALMRLNVSELNLKIQGQSKQERKYEYQFKQQRIYLENLENNISELIQNHMGDY